MTLPRVRVTVFLVLCGVARPLAGEVVRDFQVAKCTTRWLNVSATKTPPSGARARRGPTQQPIQSFLPWKKNKQHSQGRTEPHKPAPAKCAASALPAAWATLHATCGTQTGAAWCETNAIAGWRSESHILPEAPVQTLLEPKWLRMMMMMMMMMARGRGVLFTVG